MPTATEPVTLAAPGKTWSARIFSLPVTAGVLLVWLLFVHAGSSIADPDIWWHLRNAAQLLHTGHFVRTDTWTFTVAGKLRIDFEWLSELPYYFAWRRLGDRGIYLVMMLVSSAIILGVYALAWMRSRNATAAILVSVLAVLFATVSLAPRTILFGWLLLVIELAILWALPKGRDYTAWLPPLFLVWINTHGSWFIGFVLMVLYFACGLVEGEWGSLYATRWTPRQLRKLFLVTVATFACLFINPYGWRLVAYPLDTTFGQNLSLNVVVEWSSLNFHTANGKVVLATFILLGILQLLRRRRWPLADLVFVLVAVYGSFTYARFVFLAGILMLPILAMDLESESRSADQPAKDLRLLNAVVMVAFAAILVMRFPSERQLQADAAKVFPEKALPYVRSLAGSGNLFNEYEWGGYLELEAPQVKQLIDSRADIFEHEGILKDYIFALKARDTYEILDKYHIRYVLLGRDYPASCLLSHSTGWKRTYDDGQAVVFERIR